MQPFIPEDKVPLNNFETLYIRFKHGNKAAYEPVTKGLEGL